MSATNPPQNGWGEGWRGRLRSGDVGGSAVMNAANLAGGSTDVVPKRFVEPEHVPPELATRSIAILIAALAFVSAVPPARAWLDGEPDGGPRNVEVDLLAGAEDEWMLADRRRKPGVVECLDQVALQSGLSGTALPESVLEPALDPPDTVLAATSMAFEVLRHL